MTAGLAVILADEQAARKTDGQDRGGWLSPRLSYPVRSPLIGLFTSPLTRRIVALKGGEPMVKVFLVSATIVVLAVVGVFAAIFGPLVSGVGRNLGGGAPSVFQAPVPQPFVSAWNDAASQTTPSVLLTGVVGIIALLVIYTIGTLAARALQRGQRRRRLWTELRWRGRVAVARESRSAPRSEFESMWK